MEEPLLYLASNSPRRRQILAQAGRNFLVCPAEVDETPRPGETPGSYVRRLAAEKARAAALTAPAHGCIIAADTCVADGSLILGKPASPADARVILQHLRGRAHQALTGLAVYQPGSDRLKVETCVTQVTMRDYTDAEIETYVASGDPLDKAGAYAIQHAGFHPVERLEGCFANVMGLPVCLLEQMLSAAGVPGQPGLADSSQNSDICPLCRKLARGVHEN